MMQRADLAETAAIARRDDVDGALRPLLGHRLPHAGARRAHARAGLLEAGASPAVADAIARVPRSPFVPLNCWRLADALGVAHPGLPAPRPFAALLDAVLALRAATLVMVEPPEAGWCGVVAGVLAAAQALQAATTAAPGARPRGLAETLRALGVGPGFTLDAARGEGRHGFVCCEPLDRPPADLLRRLAEGDCVAWIGRPEGAQAPGRVLRVQRRRAGLALTDLGEAA